VAGGLPTIYANVGVADTVLNGGYLYWQGKGFVQRAPRAGGLVENVLATPNENNWITFDANYMYTMRHIPDTAILRTPIAGGATETVIVSQDPNFLPQKPAIDAKALYWYSSDGNGGGTISGLAK
jgi:hypothetical protein